MSEASNVSTEPLSEMERQHLNSAFVKLHWPPLGAHSITLYVHEAEALYKEYCRLANFATLLGEPSPAEMAGIFTQEEIEGMSQRGR